MQTLPSNATTNSRNPSDWPERPQVDMAFARATKRLLGCVGPIQWAEPGKVHKGNIVGFDTNVVFQIVGRKLVMHDKSLLPHIPGKATKVAIAYPADPCGMADIANPAPKRGHDLAP